MADLERAAVNINDALEAIKRVDPPRKRIPKSHMVNDMAHIDPAGVRTLLHSFVHEVLNLVQLSACCKVDEQTRCVAGVQWLSVTAR